MTLTLRLLLVLALDAALAAEIWAVGKMPLDITAIAPTQRGAPADTDPDNASAATVRPVDLPLLDRNHVLTRPLFTATRRPWQPPPEPAPVVRPLIVRAEQPQEPPPPAPRLMGIGVSSGQARALLGDPVGFETVWVGEGETAWTWVVRKIDGQSVTVEYDRQVVPLSLYPDREGG